MRPPAARPEQVDVLVAGGGLAGLRTAAALREAGLAGTVLLVGAEEGDPYDRTTLSTHLFTQEAPPLLSAGGLGDLDALGVPHRRAAVRSVRDLAGDDAAGDYTTGEDAAGSTPGTTPRPAVRTTTGPGAPAGARAEVTLDDGTVVRARVVVAATGARAVAAPWPGARTLRSAADATGLRAALAPGARLVVVGAGWIGAEVAGAAAAAGVRVTVVETADEPLGRAPRVLGRHVRGWFESAGVELLTGTGVSTVALTREAAGPADPAAASDAGPAEGPDAGPADPGERVVTLTDGREVRADVVLAALGAVPETDWLAGAAPLAPTGHVRVDALGRALDGPTWLWAVGDAAATVRPDGRTEPGAHWEGALHHPTALAAGVLGLDAPPPPASYVFSEMFGHDVAVLGDPTGPPTVERSDDAGITWLWTDDAGRLVGAATADHPRDVPPLRRALAGGGRPNLDAAVAADPSRRLRDAIARR
ncbi:FAD-dependent oxidoreductase [Georgenia sp. Z1491]|uniref:FAD-dependent oxidoreductase n=1 Tax=Georgenia sp. Z1491 TaxID=3416707 RepID=UPI003CF6EC9D